MDKRLKNLMWPLLGLFFALLAIAFLFAPIVTYVTKITVDGESVKTPYDVGLIQMLNGSVQKPWSIYVLLAFLFLGGVFPFLGLLLPGKKDSFAVVSAFFFLIAICLLAVEREVFEYYNADSIENYNSTKIAWGSGVSIACAALGAFSSLMGPKRFSKSESIRGISEDAVLIALAFVLNFIKLPIQASGSINLQMLPLMIIALRRGPIHGFVCGGIVYGFLTCMTDGYGFFTFPFDYLIGFGSVAVMGIVRPWVFGEKALWKRAWVAELLILGAGVVATFIRFIGSSISSMVFYELSMKEAMLYNIVYIPVSGALAIAALMLLYPALFAVNKRYPVEREKAKEKPEPEE